MTTVKYKGGIPYVFSDEITEYTSATVTLTQSSQPTSLCNAASNPINVVLPLASTCEGTVYVVKKIDSSSNTVTISRSGSDLIDGKTSIVISNQYVSYAFQSDGTNWYIADLDSDASAIEAEISARREADSSLQAAISGINSYEVTSNVSIVANDEVFADTTSGIITLTLPASPANGSRVRVIDPKGTWGTNKCVIARNGNKIAGFSSDLELTVPSDSVNLVFYSTTSDWRLY